MHSETCVNSSVSLQMAVNPIQPLMTSKQCLQTISEVEWCQHGTVCREHSNANIKTNKMVSKPWAACTMPSQLQETGNLPGSQLSTCLEMHRNPPNSPHTAIPSILKQTAHGPCLWTCSRLEQCQGSTVDRKHSNVNNKSNKIISKWTACNMLYQIYRTGNLLIPQHAMCIKTHKMSIYSLQMAILPIQLQLNNSSAYQQVKGLKLHHTDVVGGEHSNVNIKTMKHVSRHWMMCNTLSTIQKGRCTCYPTTDMLKNA